MKLFSFLMGIRLFYLGNAIIGGDYSKHKQYHVSTFHTGISSKITSGYYFPIPFGFSAFRTDYDVTSAIQSFLDSFLSSRERFKLDNAFFLIQSARFTAFELQVQPLAAAYDTIKSAWFKSECSKSKGKYISEINFENIIENYIPAIREDLGAGEATEIVLNKLRKSNEIGLTQGDRIFFNELQIELGPIETFAFKIRNSVVHGGLSENRTLVEFTNRAYHTLLNRVVLHLLGGREYIDYTTSPQSIRSTVTSLKGPTEDGKIPAF